MRNPMGEIERAARKVRERQGAAATKTGETEAARARRQTRMARALLVESLGGTPEVTFLQVVEAMILFFTPWAVLLWIPAERRSTLVFASLALVSCLGFVLHIVYRERLLAAIRKARLARLGCGFDAAHYFRLLSRRRRSFVVVSRLRFRRPWAPDEMTAVHDAMGEWAKEHSATWRDDRTLEIRSDTLEGIGYVSDDSGSVHFFTNRRAHDAFMSVVRHVLPRLHAANPVIGLEVDIQGGISTFEENVD